MITLQKVWLYSIALLILSYTPDCHGQMASQMAPDKSQSPVAISSLPSGKLVALGGRGRLSLIEPGSGKVTVLKSTLGYFTPADMVAARVGEADAIFVALYNATQRRGMLAKYSLSGEELQTWVPRATVAGIAID